MGKQINYWMDYDSFCELAALAVDLGGTIVKKDNDTKRVIQSKDIAIVTRDCYKYCFYVPDAGELKIANNQFGEYIDKGYSETQNAIIEAGYSRISDERKQIYTELVDVYKLGGAEYVHKEYVTGQCLELRNREGYSLVYG